MSNAGVGATTDLIFESTACGHIIDKVKILVDNVIRELKLATLALNSRHLWSYHITMIFLIRFYFYFCFGNPTYHFLSVRLHSNCLENFFLVYFIIACKIFMSRFL